MVFSLFRNNPDSGNANGSGGGSPLRLGNHDEPHIADGEHAPGSNAAQAAAPESGNIFTGFLGELGRSAQATLAPLRTLSTQPLIPPRAETNEEIGEILNRDPYAAAKERQQRRQTQAEAHAMGKSLHMPGGLPIELDERDEWDDRDAPTEETDALFPGGVARAKGRFDHRRPVSVDEPAALHGPGKRPSSSSLVPSLENRRPRRQKHRKSKLPPEQLVIVRPPQTKHVHPFNLQIQLVSKRARRRPGTHESQSSGTSPGNSAGRSSFDSWASGVSALGEDNVFPPEVSISNYVADSTGGSSVMGSHAMRISPSMGSHGRVDSSEELVRRPSTGSEHSQQSADTISTFNSGGNQQNYRTRVIPLYNLGFHTILPTCILDAGTDERVAKVTKRGFVELEDLAVLEPTELILGVNDLHTLDQTSAVTRPASASFSPRPKTPLEPVQSASDAVSEEGEDEQLSNAVASPSFSLNNVPKQLSSTGELINSSNPEAPSTAPPTTADYARTAGAPVHARSQSEQSHDSTSINASKLPSAQPLSSGGALRKPLFGRPTSASADGSNKIFSGFKRLLNNNNNSHQRNASSSTASHTSPSTSSPMGLVRSSTNLSHGSSDRRGDVSRRSTLLSRAGTIGLGSDIGIRDADTASITTRTSLNLGGGDGVPMWPIDRKSGSRRAQGYIWTIRRWLRSGRPAEAEEPPRRLRASDSMGSVRSKSTDGSGPWKEVWSQYNLVDRAGGHEVAPPARCVPIRIEWTRETSRMRRERGKESARATTLASLEQRPASNTGVGLSRSSTTATSPSRVGFGAPQTTSRPSSSTTWQHGLDSRTVHGRSLHGPEAGWEEQGGNDRMDETPTSQDRVGRTTQRAPATASGLARSNTSVPDRKDTTQHRGSQRLLSSERRATHETHDQQPHRKPSKPSKDHNSDTEGEASEPESDPEDSERPWRCALVLGPRTRVPLALLTPAPHHPKVVGQLLIPYPLPDLSGSGLGSDAGGLSPEELKDITMTTSLHLVVREGFGILSKAKR